MWLLTWPGARGIDPFRAGDLKAQALCRVCRTSLWPQMSELSFDLSSHALRCYQLSDFVFKMLFKQAQTGSNDVDHVNMLKAMENMLDSMVLDKSDQQIGDGIGCARRFAPETALQRLSKLSNEMDW